MDSIYRRFLPWVRPRFNSLKQFILKHNTTIGVIFSLMLLVVAVLLTDKPTQLLIALASLGVKLLLFGGLIAFLWFLFINFANRPPIETTKGTFGTREYTLLSEEELQYQREQAEERRKEKEEAEKEGFDLVDEEATSKYLKKMKGLQKLKKEEIKFEA